ncbi:MAG: aldose 1-epimerase [Acidobacteriota bacterium]|nr:aldose 1-epimerase [Acidobacteriota bacterium]
MTETNPRAGAPLQRRTVRSAEGGMVVEVVPAANMLCASIRHAAHELVDERGGVARYAEHGSTMGVPLLYPWANRLSAHEYEAAGKRVRLPRDTALVTQDPSGLPIHGVLPRWMAWSPGPPQHGGSRLTAQLEWDERLPVFSLFPFEHRLSYEILAEEDAVTFAVTLRACGEDHVPACFGFHPYLRPGGGAREEWEVRMPDCERLLLDGRMLPTGERVPVAARAFALGHASFDDAFAGLSATSILSIGGPERSFDVALLEGYRYAQLYAPAGERFVCLEPMTAPADALRSGVGLELVAPGAELRASFRIALGR